MRKLLISIFFLVFFFEIQAQDRLFSQFYASPLTLNPALTGAFEGKFRVSSIYRDQWRKALDEPYQTFSSALDLRWRMGKEKSRLKDHASVGVMFFQDKVAGYSEAFRVLKPSSRFVFSVWDRIEQNEFCWCVNVAVRRLFPEDPPELMARTAYGYYDTATIAQELNTAGFGVISIETVERLSHAPSARDLAIGFCQGSPLRSEIEARAAARLGEATDAATQALLTRFGAGPVVGKMRAHVFSATRE